MPKHFAWQVGRALGAFVGSLPGRETRRCQDNLSKAFPEWPQATVKQRCKQTFAHFGGMALETLVTIHDPPQNTAQKIYVHGIKHLRAYVRMTHHANKGGMLSSGHMGNWELLGLITGSYYPMTVIGKRMRNPDVQQLTRDLRERFGNRLLDQADGVMACMRDLREGRLLATLPDQSVRKLAGCFVPWFGAPAWTPIGPGMLAVMSRTPMMPAYMLRHGRAWHLHLSEPIVPDRKRPREEAAAVMMAEVCAAQERLLRRFPTQWVWWHMRWRMTQAKQPDSLTVQADLSVVKTGELLSESE